MKQMQILSRDNLREKIQGYKCYISGLFGDLSAI